MEQAQDCFDRAQSVLRRIPPPGPNSVGCAKCCAIFSTTGVIFLIVIGNLIKSQPIYVVGIDSPASAATNVFGAAWIYVAMIIVSVGVLTYDKMNAQQRTSRGRGPDRAGYPQYGSISYKSEF